MCSISEKTMFCLYASFIHLICNRLYIFLLCTSRAFAGQMGA